MTVRELVERLSAMDMEAVVLSEGCDCVGGVKKVDVVLGGKAIWLRRSVHPHWGSDLNESYLPNLEELEDFR